VSTDSVSIVGGRPLRGRIRLPGEKGMSHRALIFAALAEGDTTIAGLAPGDDVARTLGALGALGVRVTHSGGHTIVAGAGVGGLREPTGEIDCGNSGTTLRLLAGLVAGRPFRTVLTGDESLRSRPMARVAIPLREMGAQVEGRDGGALAPLTIRGGGLVGRQLTLERPSGQVKTALVLAGLQADGTTEIVEPGPSRDHTERMLAALGAPVEHVDDRTVRVTRGAPRAFELALPGDPSSAAFLIVAATLTPGSEVVIDDLLLNPGRIEFIDVLRRMGASIDVEQLDERLGEPVGRVSVCAASLHATTVSCSEPIIDEVPVLAVAAAFADGITEFRDAAELRVKESDRIESVVELLVALGISAEPRLDGLVVRGGRPLEGSVRSHGDHRIALAGAVAAIAVDGVSTVNGWSAVSVSYPGFLDDLEHLAHDR
jgi:3-phosphoshikimate 1-carboxyvinyltransferase